MGTFNVKLQIGDPQGRQFEEVDALVDTGASFTTVSASLLRRLGVEPRRRVRFRLANNAVEERDVGVTTVRYDGHESVTSVVFGEEGRFLFGALTLEDMLLTVDPIRKRLVPVEGLLMAQIHGNVGVFRNMDERIVIDPRIQHGKPVIKGTRVPIERLAGSFIGGMAIPEIAEDYAVSEEDVVAAIIYAKAHRMNWLEEEPFTFDEGEWQEFRL
ncbi:MAG: DUF433 domain-containing protein [Chloroflexi bacterium]|nr:DUF433 domain-containing protein [Chloroflexota bacterium]